MADLTVLILSPSPLPGFPSSSNPDHFLVSRQSVPVLAVESAPSSRTSSPTPLTTGTTTTTTDTSHDHSLLSPPVNSFKSRSLQSELPARPATAPPTRSKFLFEEDFREGDDHLIPHTSAPHLTRFPRKPLTPTTTRGGELVRPPPPLLRPTTFWRRTRRSGVTGASYSPSSHLIRRSTFIAAGLSLESPRADLSAFCVESRIGFIQLPPDQTFQ